MVSAVFHVPREARTTGPVAVAAAPDDVPEGKGPPTARMAGAIRHRMVSGQPGEPGRAVAWLALDGEIISGACPANFV